MLPTSFNTYRIDRIHILKIWKVFNHFLNKISVLNLKFIISSLNWPFNT